MICCFVPSLSPLATLARVLDHNRVDLLSVSRFTGELGSPVGARIICHRRTAALSHKLNLQ